MDLLGGKIEFYGEYLSLLAIAKKIGIERMTLKKYYDKTNNIYEAEKICKEIIKDKEASLIEYNGERLAIGTIAKKAGFKDAKTLKKYYEQTGDIYLAIDRYNSSKIEYYGENLTLDAIAKKAGVKRDTLEVYYKASGDIYEAVNSCLEIKRKAEEAKVLYKGEKRTLTSIAKELGISKNILAKYYQATNDIEEAITLYNKNKEKAEERKLLYNGEYKFIKEIAKEEDIAETTLRRYIEKYGNLEKAVLMAKIQKQKTRTIKMKNSNVSLYDLSIILGMKYSELINSLNSGMSIEEIKKQNQNKTKRNKLKQEYNFLPNGQTLLEYCVEAGVNYAFIYRAINTYGKTLDEAVNEYRNNGSQLPHKWIFEKYGILLRHLFVNNGINIQRVVDYMRKEQISIIEAIEKYIIRKNAKDLNLDADWMQEVYGLVTDGSILEQYQEFKSIFFIDVTEEKCIQRSEKQVKEVERKFLLFDFCEVIKENTFDSNEIKELLQLYDIHPQEIELIFLDLYAPYQDGILLGEKQEQFTRRELLNGIVRKWHFLGQSEREDILNKNNITESEKETIIVLSRQIVKYKGMLNIEENNIVNEEKK